MSKFYLKLVLIPLIPVLLLIAVNIFLISRVEEVPSLYQENHIAFPDFRTRDLRGNIVTQDIFMGRFSVVCLWVTREAGSRDLLERLAAWKESSDEKFQLVGIVGDVRETDSADKISAARSMADVSGGNIPQLLVNDGMEDFLKRIRNAPTVCFVNEHGSIVGQPVIGNEPELIQKEALRLMQADSSQSRLGRKVQDSLFR